MVYLTVSRTVGFYLSEIFERFAILNQKPPVSVNILKPFTGWVLDGLIRDAANAGKQALHWNIFARGRSDWIHPKVIMSTFFPKRGEIALFAHHETFFNYGNNPIFKNSEKRIYLTHLNDGANFSKDEISMLNDADHIFTQNREFQAKLISLGIARSKLLLAPGSVDRKIYFPHKNQVAISYVLISGYFKYRKNPELIAEVISRMPDFNFIFHGRFREEFPFGFFESNQNVKWLEFDKKFQPELMRNASLFLSLSRIEGGPIGLLEALASGVPVVATDTGFAKEFLTSENGFLLANNPNSEEVIYAIRRTLDKFKDEPRRDFLAGENTPQDLAKILFAPH